MGESSVFTGEGADWRNCAMLGSSRKQVPWGIYAMGYKEAADQIIDGIRRGGHGQDYLVFPVLFLYRHYVELMLKGLILECLLLTGVERPEKTKPKERHLAAHGHNLTDLWGYVQELMPKVWDDFDPALFRSVDRIVKAFATHDAQGDAARFPEDLQRAPTLQGLERINLRILREDMTSAQLDFHSLDYELGGRDVAAIYACELYAGDLDD